MRKAALHNLGCKVNAYETEAMQQLLENAGYEIVPFHETADVYVINTCSVTNMADRKSRQMIHRARKQNPQSIVVAAGCYVQSAGGGAAEDGMADIILGNNKKNRLVPMIEQFERERRSVSELEDVNDGKKEYERLSITKTAEHTRAFIKVQDGCSQFCSYCIIPYTRGRVRSRALEDILCEIRTLAAGGCREVVLTGIHLSSYGVDTGDSLLHLVAEAHNIEGVARIRLGSLEPGIITEEFVRALADMEKFCPHFHLSLQSGCDATLKRMNRRYTTEEYADRCALLRRYFKNPAITTDVIVGFPGETDEEFQQTKRFLERIRFYEMHIFKYSMRKGTRAAGMEPQVAEPVKAERSAELIALGAQMSKAYRDSFLGTRTSALLEEPLEYGGVSYYAGYTKEYVKVAVEAGKNSPNSIVFGKITRQLDRELYLMVEF